MSEDGEHKSKRPQKRLIAGVEVLFDAEGFFLYPSQWTEEVFEVLAHEAGVREITEPQRRAVLFVREFFTEQGKAPLNHHLKAGTGMSMSELEALFPGGIKLGLSRLSGMTVTKGCRKSVGWNAKKT